MNRFAFAANAFKYLPGKDAMVSALQSGYEVVLNRVLASIAVGSVIAQLCVSWLNLCGNSPISLACLMIGYAAGAIVANWVGDFLPLHIVRRNRVNMHALCLATAILLLCWLLPELLNATLLAGSETVGAGGALQSLLVFMFPALIVAVLSSLAGLYFQSVTPVYGGTWMRSFLAGGLGVSALLTQLFFEIPLALTATAATLLSFVFYTVFRLSTGNPEEVSPRFRSSVSPIPELLPLHFCAVGMLAISVSETVSRLLPISVPVMLLSVGIAACGLLAGSAPKVVNILNAKAMNAIALLIVAAFPIMFTGLAEFNLWVSNHEGSALGVIIVRALQCAGLEMAVLLPAVLASSDAPSRSGGRVELLSATGGIVLGLILVSRGFSPLLVMMTGLLLHTWALFTGIRKTNSDLEWQIKVKSRVVTLRASSAMFAIPCLIVLGNFDTVRTSSLLFSARTSAAIERGVDRDLIAQSDANRLVATVAAGSGEFSVWRRAGNVVEFQRNGVSLGKVSTNTTLSPQPAEEILPAIMALVSHPRPSRVLLLGDDNGACLRTCSNFPVSEIVAVRSERGLTELAHRFTWSGQAVPADEDSRVRILHTLPIIALKDRTLKRFEVVVASSDSAQLLSGACQFTSEFYSAARSRMTADGVFCQRFRQLELGPEPIKEAMSTMLSVFAHVGAVQTVPGEILLFATDNNDGLIDREILSRLQREHVQAEIASTGWDWAEVAILPLVDAKDPVGIFNKQKMPGTNSIGNASFVMHLPFESARSGSCSEEIRQAFAPHQIQLLGAVPVGEGHQEVKRRLSALTQQREILAGMPDQPWTYRKSLRMEMQQSPRPPMELVQNGHIVKTSHPLDVFSQDYFKSLGRALTAISQSEPAAAEIESMERFTDNPEPLLSHFAHYEIVRLHELAGHPNPADEFRHRLHIVFFTSPSDASVRPVISSIEQLVQQPTLVADDSERYDMLNSLLQKLIERWEARTAWEPRSAIRVQNDVDQSVRVTNLALDLMESDLASADVTLSDFFRRRRYLNAALISPLRDYRDRVLAHRMKTEKPAERPAESDTEDPNDMPLLLNSGEDLSTN